MNIVTFEKQHIEEAKAIAFANYQEERSFVSTLPEIARMPGLDWFAENGLGVAALENGELVGFLCCVGPFDNAFASQAKGTFSPPIPTVWSAESKGIYWHDSNREVADGSFSQWADFGAKAFAGKGIESWN